MGGRSPWVYIVETDRAHPLLGLLRLLFSEDISLVSAKASSLEEWQKEARRLELQGKQEQADAIRKDILRVTPVPWPLLNRRGFRQAYERAFAPKSIFGKAKQHLYEFGAFHGLTPLCMALGRAGYTTPRSPQETAKVARERTMGPYLTGYRAQVVAHVDRHGIEHRCMMGMTPLMMSADVGDVSLVEMLLDRGARIDAVDTLGRMPVHFALRRGFTDSGFAADKLGALWELLCPTALEIEVDGRRERLSRSQGEFLVLLFLVARFHELYTMQARRRSGFTSKMIDEKALAAFPRSVVPEWQRRREYWNGVLARGEVASTYRPTRKLWRRERFGQYVPSEAVAARVAGEADGTEAYVSLSELLAVKVLDGVWRERADPEIW